jgi:alpha-N-arabinofuranosidase
MREVDPAVQLVACGWENSYSWNATVLDVLAPVVDYLSLHLYIGRDDFATAMAQPLVLEQLSRWHAGLARLVCREHGLRSTIPLSWDEWNVWFQEQTSPVAGKEIYTLRDALAVAGCLNALIRCADVVALANLAILVNVIAPIYADAQGMFRQTIFWPLMLYRRLAGWRSLRPSVRGEGYRATYTFRGWAIDEEIPYLDVAAAIDPDERTLVLGVVNRHADAAIETELRLAGLQAKAECLAEVVDGPEVGSYNSMEQPDVVAITQHTWTADAQWPRYRFTPHSLTVLTIPLG